MTDRELLELAAKAAGHDTSHPWNAERLTMVPPVMGLCIPNVSTCWDPLTDDGPALRLAVKLSLLVSTGLDESWAQSYGTPEGEWLTIKEKNGTDPYAAVRRAITRAAAEIGRAL